MLQETVVAGEGPGGSWQKRYVDITAKAKCTCPSVQANLATKRPTAGSDLKKSSKSPREGLEN